ncbi:MAG: NlpC/P60 family protein [Streptosporangiales bacterium]|nr:NlpC/P60 family protein [Streptosporangiales bacterium]
MEHARRAAIPQARPSFPYRSRLLRAVALLAMVAVANLVPASAGYADPGQGDRGLEKKLDRLGRQAESLTERYNGQRVALADARRSARAAAEGLEKQERELATLRSEVGAAAAAQYMTSGLGPEVTMLTSDDPQTVLDQAAFSRHLGAQQTARLREFVQAQARYEQMRAAAKQRAAKTRGILDDLEKKKAKIEKLTSEIEARLGPTQPVVVDLPNVSIEGKGKAAEAVRQALSQLGKPYQWGGAGPDSYDCSGLMMWAYRNVGISLPHYTGAQYGAGPKVPRDQLQPGDILFFYPDLGHNGMYMGNGKMVHAPRTGKNVEVVDLAPYYWANFVGAVRVVS